MLFNPSSGRGRSLKKRSQLEAVLQRTAIPFDWYSSRSEQHMRELARSLSRDYSTLITAGGDTSFRIVAAEVLNSGADPVLVFVGIGSANDIAHSLINAKIATLGSRLKCPQTRRMDVGKLEIMGCEDIYFLGNLSLGLGVEVNRYVAEFWRRHPLLAKGGSFIQLLAGFAGTHDAFTNRKVPFHFKLGSEAGLKMHESSLLIFSNISFYAGGLKIAPGKTPFNGKLDCCLVQSENSWSTLKIAIRAIKGRHINNPAVKVISGRTFIIQSDTQLDVQVDGDVLPGGKHIKVSVLPEALTVMV